MPSSLQHALAAHLRFVAEWRRGKMQEFDADPRNLRSAAGLEELAAYVLGLPEDDPRLVTLQRLTMQGEMFRPGQMVEWEIPRFRFYHEHGTLDGFLTRLAELAQKDAAESGSFGGRFPEGDNPWARRPTRIYIVEVEKPDDEH